MRWHPIVEATDGLGVSSLNVVFLCKTVLPFLKAFQPTTGVSYAPMPRAFRWTQNSLKCEYPPSINRKVIVQVRKKRGPNQVRAPSQATTGIPSQDPHETPAHFSPHRMCFFETLMVLGPRRRLSVQSFHQALLAVR